jgi:DNA (cytosine-5)-methyltransferase 1
VRTHVDLCSGIGGFALGFIAAKLSEPVLFCDFDEKVRKLLRVRFPGIPIANDVKEIASDPKRFIHERPFILSSGYPCQPWSQASSNRKGEEDSRHIFPHIAEIVAQTRPTYAVFENVYGHISLGLDKVLSQMGSLDYATATFVIPATSFRPHKRDRLWIICKNLSNTRCEYGQEGNSTKLEQTKTKRPSRHLHSESSCKGSGRTDKQDHTQTFTSFRRIFDGISNWLDKPRHIQRTTHLNEYRADRLKQLGNALLPQITYRIGLAIKEIEDKE